MRKVELIPDGRLYIVSPLNDKKRTHRGRVCRFESMDERYAVANVYFIASQRRGRVDASDLILYQGKPC
jgi:hypothetical protein